MEKKEQQKKRLKTEVIIGAFGALRKADLSLVETFTDRVRVSDGVRLLRMATEDFEDKLKNRSELLKPAGLDELREKLRGAAERKESLDPKEVMKLNVMTEGYNAELMRSERELLEEEREIDLPPLAKETVDKVLEGNPKWNPEQMIAVMDALK